MRWRRGRTVAGHVPHRDAGEPTAGRGLIAGYELPPSVLENVAREHPELGVAGLEAVDCGLREWLVCCLHRQGTQLGMPSRAVDWAWHEFILDTRPYHDFCLRAFGEFLHHVPESSMAVAMPDGLRATVRAWDRSAGRRAGREATLWDLDARLGIPEPIWVPPDELSRARDASADPPGGRRRRSRDGLGGDPGAWALFGLGGGGHGAGDGDGGGSGCGGDGGGGSGCGGGCGGGG